MIILKELVTVALILLVSIEMTHAVLYVSLQSFSRIGYPQYFISSSKEVQNEKNSLDTDVVPHECSDSKKLEKSMCILEVSRRKFPQEKCPDNLETRGDMCISKTAPICPSGYRDVGEKCMRFAGCDTERFDQIGTKCYEKCPSGYRRYYSNLCITEKKNCPIQFRYNGTKCLYAECPVDMELSKDGLTCYNKCPKFFKKVSEEMCKGLVNICPRGFEEVPGKFCEQVKCEHGILMKGVCLNTVCPTGYRFDTSRNVCTKCLVSTHTVCSGIATICPMGLIQLGTGTSMRCVLICPRNYAQFGKVCFDISPSSCPEGQYHFEENRCIPESECPKGFQVFGNECIKISISTETKLIINGREKEECPPNYREFEGNCVKLTQNICPSGLMEIEGSGLCVKTCPRNFDIAENMCVDAKKCGPNKYSYNDRCYEKCPFGTTINKLTLSCAISNPCGKDKVYDITRSACIFPYQCSHGYFLNSDKTFCHKMDRCGGQGYMIEQYCVNSCPLDYEIDTQFCKRKVGRCPSLSLDTGKCVTECPEGHVPVNRVCVPVKVTKSKVLCGVNKQLEECANDAIECTPKCVCKEGFIEKSKTETSGGDYCVPKEVQCPYKHQLDLVFLIDGSKYMTDIMFDEVKFFIMETATKIYSSTLDVRVSVYIYGKVEPQVILLYKTERLCDVMKLVTELIRIPSNKIDVTLVDAFRITRNVLMSQCNGARIGSTKQLFVLSEFEELKNESRLNEVVQEQIDFNKKAGYRMTFLTLKNTANIPKSIYKILVDSTSSLSTKQNTIFDITCKDFSCSKGYQRMKNECIDINECDSKACHPSSLCINTPGSFECYCFGSLSYLGPAIGCSKKKTDECTFNRNNTLEICEHVKCKAPANCSAHNGMAFCVCPRGFTYNSLLGCIDVDECKQNPCLGKNSHCLNQNGSFLCTCPKGYRYNVHFGCIDIDECQTGNRCSGNGICQNMIGSYVCACHNGYEYIPNRGCIDIDECENEKLCVGTMVICNNTPGSFQCICPKGYKYKDSGCIDINECMTNNTCPEGSLCKNTVGGFKCSCAKGYLYENKTNTCELDKSLNVVKPKADLIFGIDASENMKSNMENVIEMLNNIIKDYKLKSLSTIKHYFALTVGGEKSKVNLIFQAEIDKTVFKEMSGIKYIGGICKLSIGLRASRGQYEQYGQTNSSKLVIFVTATKPASFSSEEVMAVKQEVAKIKEKARLLIIYVGDAVESNEWKVIFEEKDIEEHVIAVSNEFISTIHKVIYQRTDRLIKCPDGFVFLDQVCQYKTSRTQYCKWDNKLYALNSTWNSSCAYYNCTNNGVVVLDTKCLGFDGDCYQQNQFFPCNLNGKLNWRCKCKIVEYFETETKQKQQKIEYQIIRFDRDSTIMKTQTKDNRTCVLPFKYRNEWQYACTKFLSDQRWCSWNMYYKTSQYSYCISEVKAQCIFKNNIYKEGDKWSVGCNIVSCRNGQPLTTAKCPTLNGTCVPLDAENYPCMVKGDEFKSCICIADNFGYGENSGIKGKVVQKKKPGTDGGLVSYCEQKTTGHRYEVGDIWSQDCFDLQCTDNGVTNIISKQCKAIDGTCIRPNSKQKFKCEIGGKLRQSCECVVENNELVLLHNEGGKAERKVVQKKTIIELM